MRQIKLNGYAHYWDHIELARSVVASTPVNELDLPIGFYSFDLLDLSQLRVLHQARDASRNFQVRALGSDADTAQSFLPSDSSEPGSPVHHISTTETVSSPDSSGSEEGVSNPLATAPRSTAGFEYDRTLKIAYKELVYAEGWPTFNDGRPFWSRLEYEPTEAYEVFQIWLYRPTEESTPRALHELQNSLMAKGIDVDRELLQVWFTIHYWGARAKAYDLFAMAQSRKQMELRAIGVMDEHWMQSRRLMNKLSVYIEGENSEEFWELLTPKNAIDLLKHLHQVQRLSAGLPANAPPTERAGHPAFGSQGGQSMESLLRSLAKGIGGEQTRDDSEDFITRAMEDETTASLAQEFLLKLAEQQMQEGTL